MDLISRIQFLVPPTIQRFKDALPRLVKNFVVIENSDKRGRPISRSCNIQYCKRKNFYELTLKEQKLLNCIINKKKNVFASRLKQQRLLDWRNKRKHVYGLKPKQQKLLNCDNNKRKNVFASTKLKQERQLDLSNEKKYVYELRPKLQDCNVSCTALQNIIILVKWESSICGWKKGEMYKLRCEQGTTYVLPSCEQDSCTDRCSGK